MAQKCLYSGDKHTPITNTDGGFIYCAECSSIIKITDETKAKIWFGEK